MDKDCSIQRQTRQAQRQARPPQKRKASPRASQQASQTRSPFLQVVPVQPHSQGIAAIAEQQGKDFNRGKDFNQLPLTNQALQDTLPKLGDLLANVRSQAHEWKESDLQLLKSLAPQVAIALFQAQLEHKAQQQIRYQAINDQLTAAIRSDCELAQIFDLALTGLATSLRVSRALVLLFKYIDPLHQRAIGTVAPEARVNVAAAYPKVCELQMGGRLGSLSFGDADYPADLTDHSNHELRREQEQGTWVDHCFAAIDCGICQDFLTGAIEPKIEAKTEHLEPSQAISPIFQVASFPALLLMPIEHQGISIGGLVLQHHEPRSWTVEELSFIKLVAAQLSTAMIQARTFQQIQAVVAERTMQLQRSLELQAKLYATTRQQVAKLNKLNEEREEFLSTVSHELLTPLTSMGLAIRMLRQATLSPDRQARYLDILEQQCQQETQLINDMLALRKLENEPSTTQAHKLDLRYLVRTVAQTDADRWQQKGLELRLHLPNKPLTIFSDPDGLTRILTELLNNARKYADANSQVDLTLAYQQAQPTHNIVLTLRNRGVGIQPEEIDRVFDKFTRGEVAAKLAIQGTGLGLTLVQRLVEHMKGAIAVTSAPIPDSELWETCFTLTLPPCPDGVIRAIS
jgi:signal transduction histidine kinase